MWVCSREGQVVRQRVTPLNPQAPAQEAARARLTTVTRLFKGLSPQQELAWEQHAANLPERDPVTGKATLVTLSVEDGGSAQKKAA